MSSQLTDSLVRELNEKFEDRSFFTLPDLVSIGFFGNVQAARNALKAGKLSYIKISKRRCIVPRSVLLEYLQINISNNGGVRKQCS